MENLVISGEEQLIDILIRKKAFEERAPAVWLQRIDCSEAKPNQQELVVYCTLYTVQYTTLCAVQYSRVS